ncbi:hypothetical protein [uncultured Psychroserpens sp.]|nr:hypothetical protein [uncultured Psychroserpens sp.]
MRTHTLSLLFALLVMGVALTSCSVDNEDLIPAYSTGDEVDDTIEPFEGD